MDIAFVGEEYKFMVVYLDDIIVFSKTDEEDILHLNLTFEKCRRYGLVIGKSSVYAELLVPLRQVAILETNKLKLLFHVFRHNPKNFKPNFPISLLA